MKKALLWTFVTLLVMVALVSCDDVIGGMGGKYTPDGKMVTVNIVTDMGRSITEEIAKESWNYYEVIFGETDSGPYHRGSGLRALGLTITLPAKVYEKENTLLLLGTNTGKTLVATGRLDDDEVDIADVSGPILFTVTAIEASLLATDTSLVLAGAGNSGGSYFGSSCFRASTASATTGTLTFTGFDETGDSILLTGTSRLRFFDITATVPPTPAAGLFSGSIAPTPTGPSVGTGAFELSFTAEGTPGDALKGVFEIPVVGFDVSGVTWNLRGGTVSGVADLENNGHEGFVLLIYNASAQGTVTIDIGGW